MGLSHHAAAERDARLVPSLQPAGKADERGHGRGTIVDHRRGGDAALRGIPLIGVGAGAIRGTAPGGEVGWLMSPRRVERQLGERDRLVIRERIKAAREELRFKSLASRP